MFINIKHHIFCMNFVNATYLPSKEFEIVSKQQELNSKLNSLVEVEGNDRPTDMSVLGTGQYGGQGYGYYSGYGTIGLWDLYWMWRLSDVCVTIGHALKRKVFKGGLDLEPKITEPSEEQERKINRFVNECNKDGQHFIEVLKEIEDDFNSVDKGCMLLVKNYLLDRQGNIKGSKLKEVVRLNPIWFFELRDNKGRLGYSVDTNSNNKSRRAYVTINDRNNLVYDPIDPVTGNQNIEVHYRYASAEGSTYYNRNEVIYKNKFKKFGFSPLFSLYNKVLTLIEMDYYVRMEYSEGKPSKKMLAFKTQDREKFGEAFQDYDNRMKKNPHRIHPLIVQTSVDNKQPLAEVIDFMRPLDEMQFTEMRSRFITDIGAPYGVSPMFMNDMSTGGGLNNEGLQITVTNEAVEGDKDLFNLFYIEPIFRELGITDWDVKLYPSEEEDQAYKQDLLKKQLDNAKLYLELNGEVAFKDNEFIFKENDNLEKSEAATPFGLMKSEKVDKEMFIDIEKPFAGYDDFSACVIDQTNSGHSKQSANKICGFLQARGKEATLVNQIEKEMEEREMMRGGDNGGY